MKLIMRFIKPYRKLLIFTIILIILDIVGALYIPTLVAEMLNEGTNGSTLNDLYMTGIKIIIASLVSGVGAILGGYTCSLLSSKICKDIRDAIYEKSLKLSVFDFKQFGTASITTRTISDITNIQTAFTMFIQMVLPVPIIFIVASILTFHLDTILTIYTPFKSAQVVDSIWQNIQSARNQGVAFSITWDGVGKSIFSLSLLYLFTWIFYYFQSYLMASVADNLTLTLRKKIAEKLNVLPLRFFDQNKSGEILSRVTNDLDKITETLQTGFLKLLVAIGTIIGSLAVMFYYNITLTLVFIVFMIICIIITKIVSNKNLKYAAIRQESLGTLTGIVEEYYAGRNIIKAYNNEPESIKRVRESTELNRKASQKADFITNSINPLIRLITRISQAVIAVIAGNAMLNGTMTVGIVQAFFQYVNQAGEPLTEASFMINTLQSALASAERTFELLDSEEEVPDSKNPATLKKLKGKISFEHVSFGYTPSNILMKDISFTVKPGQKIAIVGSTGAGKTTLINLLMRFYEINSGKILIDGVSSKDVTRKGLRQNFGMVLQDTWIFGGTIAENIAYGKPDATREEIIDAAKAAKVDYFIRTMPQGYDTMLDNEGANLSVGQRQLLTIARVFLCNPPILILDEATSSVDTRTEKEISIAMQELMKNRTSFVIAHRLSTIRDADIILFMENGNIIEQGNHRELLEKKGAYATLYYSQFE